MNPDEDELVLRAREYADLAWLIATALQGALEGRGDPTVLAALDVITRLSLCIPANVAGCSPRIARVTIAESRDAWSVLMQVGRATADGLPVKMVDRLNRLDEDLTRRFPGIATP